MGNHVLHICNDFSWTRVHVNLYSRLDCLGLNQTIFNPLRNEKNKENSTIHFQTLGSSIVYSKILKKHHRFFFKRKISFLYKSLNEKVDLSKITLTHATTLFSDGALAYRLHKEYNIPYIITIRNTDLNLYFKFMLHLRPLGMNILKNAAKIIFISPCYEKKLFGLPFLKDPDTLKAKSLVMPNGIDDFWYNHVQTRRKNIQTPVSLLYIGSFAKGKNVVRLIQAVNLLNKQRVSFHLNLIGGGGKDFHNVMQLIKGKDNFRYLGKITDKSLLQKSFNENDIFTMPSKHETFGLVYVEALSQGIPVLFTENEGIDGYFDKNIGEAANPKSVENIAKGIKKIADNYPSYDFVPKNIVKNHYWKEIGEQYIALYNTTVLLK